MVIKPLRVAAYGEIYSDGIGAVDITKIMNVIYIIPNHRVPPPPSKQHHQDGRECVVFLSLVNY